MVGVYKSRPELKKEALEQLNGKWGNAIGLEVIYFLLAIAVNAILQSISKNMACLTTFILAPVLIVTYTYYLDYAKGNKPRLVLIAERVQKYLKGILVILAIGVFTFLWSLLLIIPGIIKAYSYSMTYFIYAENPDIGVLDAITRSRKMMDGSKARLFVLGLSFIGWAILACLTLGIGFLWLGPYMRMTITDFYLDLKEKFEPKDETALKEPVKPVDTFEIKEEEAKQEEVAKDEKEQKEEVKEEVAEPKEEVEEPKEEDGPTEDIAVEEKDEKKEDDINSDGTLDL